MRDTILRNRYKILSDLGSGSFGDTYIAEDRDLPDSPKCVVKQLKPKTSEQKVMLVARELFEKEAKALYRLGNLSSQIPKLYAHFEEDGEFYLVQEFVDGYDLTTEIIPGSPWNEGEVVKLLQEVLQVLTVVHQQNIIHRDIKPQNLMRRCDDRKIVLIDFGAVKEIKDLAANTQGQVTPTIAIGSNGYMPSEQANSDPKLCSDIYAVGVVGIQALTGKLPQDFQKDPSNGEIIWQHEANVSDKLANVLSKMVRYYFRERYQTATEALQALQALSPSNPKSVKNWKLIAGVGTGGVVAISLAIALISKSDQPKLPLNQGQEATPTISPSKQSVDYSRLQAFLQQKPPNWEAADQETTELMLKIAGSKSAQQGLFDQSEWQGFSCEAFKKIDILWSEASNGRLGFSAQNKIFNDAKKQFNDSAEQSSAFYKKIGWKTPEGKFRVDWNRYNSNIRRYEYFDQNGKVTKPNFKNPPDGHLPARLQWWDGKERRFDKPNCLM